jgi:hypothetical protein
MSAQRTAATVTRSRDIDGAVSVLVADLTGGASNQSAAAGPGLTVSNRTGLQLEDTAPAHEESVLVAIEGATPAAISLSLA